MLRSIVLTLALALPVAAQEGDGPSLSPVEPSMTAARLTAILRGLDPEARPVGTGIELTVGDLPVLVIVDPRADRMRAMVPVRGAEGMTPDEMLRVLQANFDSALDARYAVAQGRLWAVFLHPLAALERDQLISGIGQAVNAAHTYGTLYTGGATQFGGGDSIGIQRRLIDELLERGREL